VGFLSGLKGLFSLEYNVAENARPLSPIEQRGMALGAVYAANMCLPMNALTTEQPHRTVTSMLENAWGVRGPADVEPTYADLLQVGHRGYYAVVNPFLERVKHEMATKKFSARRKALQAIEDEVRQTAAGVGLDPETTLGYYTGWSRSFYSGGHDEFPSTLPASISAWDAARVVHVSRMLRDAGLVSEDDAFAAIGQAVELSRPDYSSWREFGEAFVVGRSFWTAYGDGQVDKDSGTFLRDVNQLLEKEGSPWLTVPW
jgi:hypothetical protein